MPSIVTVPMDTPENTVKLTLTTVKVLRVVNMAFAQIKLEDTSVIATITSTYVELATQSS